MTNANKTPDYELIFLQGKPRAITLQDSACNGYSRFVALEANSDNANLMSLVDTDGKKLTLTHPGNEIDFSETDLSLTVFVLTDSGDAKEQFDVFLEF